MILKNLSATLVRPICDCVYQNIGVSILPPIKEEPILFILYCKTCKTKISIPWVQTQWYITSEVPYPKGYKPKEEKMEDGTVVDTSDEFFQNYRKEIDNLSS